MSAEVHEGRKDYVEPPPVPFIGEAELKLWSFYRALVAELVATLLFLYVTIAPVIGHVKLNNAGDQCDGVGFLGIARAFRGTIFVLVYCTAGISGDQCLGAVCGVGLVKAIMKNYFNRFGGDSNIVAFGYRFWLHFQLDLQFIVHLATIPITGTGINPARSFGTVVVFNNDSVWADMRIFWYGLMTGANPAAIYHKYILRAAAVKALGSFRSNPTN